MGDIMAHFHYPDGRVLGKPDNNDVIPQEGTIIAIGRHVGPVVHPKPYGNVDSNTINLLYQPQDTGFRPSYQDVMIKPDEHHGVTNPLPNLLALAV